MIPLLQTKTGDTPHMGIFANNTRLLSRLLGGAWPGTRLHIHGTTKLYWIQDWDDPCTSWLKVLDIGGSNVGLADSVLLCNNTCVLCACVLCACVLCACELCACVLCACVCVVCMCVECMCVVCMCVVCMCCVCMCVVCMCVVCMCVFPSKLSSLAGQTLLYLYTVMN